MQWKKAVKAARPYLLPALVLLLIAVFLIFARGRFRIDFPILTPQDGVVDARDVDFSEEIYHIVNHWDYYPGQLYTPQDFQDPEIAASRENDASLDDVRGTWRLRILTQPETYLSLCSFSIDYSTRVYVNGKEVRNIGFVSDDPDEAVPKVRYMTLPLYSGETGEIEIVYQYANYMHNDGGFIQNSKISTPENIDEYQRGVTFYSLLLSSGLLFLCFYFLLCAAFQRSGEYAALALCCLVIAFRNQFFFGEHLLESSFSFFWYYRTLMLDVSWIPFSTLCLLAAFFPKAVGKKVALFFGGMVLLLSALHFILDTRSLVALCHICYYACFLCLLWVIYRLVRYFRREHKPDRTELLTIAAIGFLIVMLIREGLLTGSDATVNRFGLTPMSMVICILILAVVINSRIQRQQIMLREARQKNEMLAQVNSMNKDFLRTVAHELKTPLTVISGYAQLMERQMERSQLSEKSPERLQTIYSEADRLGEIVTQLMDYTYGRTKEAEMTAVDVDALLKSAESVLKPICAKRQNRLLLSTEGRYVIHGNHELLLQVLINLVVNASRHTEDGSITVKTEEAGSLIAFTVTDTGNGIAPEDVPHIFEKGYTTGDGRGLGLTICMETVRLHGGTLELVSTGPTGTAFRFTVPREETK